MRSVFHFTKLLSQCICEEMSVLKRKCGVASYIKTGKENPRPRSAAWVCPLSPCSVSKWSVFVLSIAYLFYWLPGWFCFCGETTTSDCAKFTHSWQKKPRLKWLGFFFFFFNLAYSLGHTGKAAVNLSAVGWRGWQFAVSVIIIIIINPLTTRVVGAPQMILQPVFSIFPCSPLPSGTCRTPDLPIPWCCLPTSSFVRLVFFPLPLCLAR